MSDDQMCIEKEYFLDKNNIILNPTDNWYIENLKPYYILTKDGQYLFASTQPGRRPDRAFFMVPEGYKLGWRQNTFDKEIGLKLFKVIREYLKSCKVVVVEGIQGEGSYEAGLRLTFSIENLHSAYMAWHTKLMIFPPKDEMDIDCWNYVVQERLPESVINEIRTFWPDFDPDEPITLYDFTKMDDNIRRVVSLRVDYFGGACKKPNLTMVWNKAEVEGLISYHAGATNNRIMKGLSGTGKTTLTVGPELQQDDAALGHIIYDDKGKVEKVQIIGLEAASFAKSEGVGEGSPEYPGLMKSTEIGKDGKRPIVLALNIDCEGVDLKMTEIAGHPVKLPYQIEGEEISSLQCKYYNKNETTNGRFVFLFSEINPDWGKKLPEEIKAEALSFKRYDVLEPMLRVTDPILAVALDSACETLITSAISGAVVGERVRRYAATDFQVAEQCHQAVLKLKVYSELGIDLGEKLVFFINNAGMMGEYDIDGQQIRKLDENGEPIVMMNKETGEPMRDDAGNIRYLAQGEKIGVQDSKTLVKLVESDKINDWIKHPVFEYLIPDPKALEEKHGMKDFCKRFNPLRFYTPEQIIEFYQRDIKERSDYLEMLFGKQEKAEELREVINVWKKFEIPTPEEIRKFYENHFGKVG